MAPRRVGLRGRSVVAIALAAFLVASSSVIWRRSLGSEQARRLHALGAERAELEARRAQLEGEVRRAASQLHLGPVAERLGMRMPSDSQVILLPRPEGRQP